LDSFEFLSFEHFLVCVSFKLCFSEMSKKQSADDHEFSDEELDVFEESMDDKQRNAVAGRNQTTYANKPYDEAIEVSQDLSMAESYDMRDKVI
jgi:hypothetical protein